MSKRSWMSRLWGRRSEGEEQAVSPPPVETPADYAFVRDEAAEVCGIWLSDPQVGHKREALVMLFAKHSVPAEISATILMGDYRMVANTFDDAGGCFVMLGSAHAPGEVVPLLESFVWRKGHENPVSQDTSLLGGPTEGRFLRYACPTCVLPVRAERSRIDAIIGVHVQCPSCKNIAHVPGAFREGPLPAQPRITGGVIVPLQKLSDWYHSHPVVESFIAARQGDFFFHYGLWGFCAKCFHQYKSSALNHFCVSQDLKPGSVLFLARSAESGRDFDSLRAGACPSCGYDRVIGIVANVPDYVRDVIEAKKGEASL